MPEDSPPPTTEPARSPAERRVWDRFAAWLTVLLQPTTAWASDYWSAARVRRVSAGGLSLHTHRPFVPGVSVRVQPVRLYGTALDLPLLRVIHATPESGGGWLVGGAFIRPLAPEELAALLAPR